MIQIFDSVGIEKNKMNIIFLLVGSQYIEREIEISGKDAHQLVQLMTCRDLSKSKVGSCYYVPLIDSNGGMVNDPLIYKLEDNIWRVCIADSDVLLYAKGIAAGKKLNVKIFEANIEAPITNHPTFLPARK